ncbi:MAG: imidazole glycerol phosphate synthase subunit HisF [Endomicrobia bacterium]|nr:imidazole glycerol phosphate synthase subunit HisF [Endomicrobiia bacterium]
MYTIRIIPCLDVKNGQVVKGVNFNNLKYAGNPVELAKWYSENGADEIVFLDITATIENRKTLLKVVEETAKKVFVPLTVGGGIKTIMDIRSLLNAGADKVTINTAAVKNPQLIEESATIFGSQCIVVAVDAKLVSRHDKKWEVYINAGKTPAGVDVLRWVKKVEKLLAGEILLTSIDADGTKMGYDIELTKNVVSNVNIPVIASGGAGKIEHFVEVVKKTKVSAVLAASVFHYRKYSIEKLKKFLAKEGIPVRL